MSINTIATVLLDAYDTYRLTELPSSREAFTLADAYAVGTQLTAWRRARGEETIGRKIGFTNRAIWPQYGVESPLWAHMYAHTVHQAEHGQATLAISHLVAPRIEAEIVLGLAEPILKNASPAELAKAIAWVALGFEVVDCHYANWQFTIADCTADFGLHAGLVVGSRHVLTRDERHHLAERLPTVQIQQYYDGAAHSQGIGANALGSPLVALGFLAETLAALGAEPLQAGEIITTGTLTPAVAIQPGHTWRIESDWDVLGTLQLRVE
jgi:2-keto-4-pentenoate hydratase